MTEKLKDLLDRAADIDFAPVDLDAVTGAGDRTVRRRRLAAGVAGLAAAAVVAGVLTGVVLGLASGGGKDRAAAASARVEPELTWVVGSVLHTDDGEQDLGHTVRAFVRTATGVVFTDDAGAVYSVQGGRLEEIGHGAVIEQGLPGLVSDEETTLVGWVDRRGPRPVFVTHDLSTGAQTRHDEHTDASMTGEDPPHLAWYVAIEDGTAYWIDRRGTVATDLASGEARVLASPAETRWIADVEDGRVARLLEDEGGGDVGLEVAGTDGRVVLEADPSYVALSPDGRWMTSSRLVASVVGIDTGDVIRLDVDGREVVPFGWVDDDTVAVLRDGHDTVDLLTCEVPSGRCTMVAGGVPGEGLVLPGGTAIFG